MRVNGNLHTSFGVLRHYAVKPSPLGNLKIFTGETSKSFIELYKESMGNNVDLKCWFIKDKSTGHIRSKIQHIGGGKVIRTIKHGFESAV